MEKSEHTLIPEWLKTSGNGTIGSPATHQTTSSSLSYSDSDDHGSAMHSRNRLSASVNSHDSGRSSFSDRTTSSYFRRGSNSNVSGHSSFGSRNFYHRPWDSRDKEKSNLSVFKRHDYSDHLDNIFPIKAGKDLRRSHSLVTGRRVEPFSGKLTPDLSINSKRNPNNSSSRYSGRGVMTAAHKTQFEKEFPSLGRDGRRWNSGLRRVSTPRLGSAIQNLPVSVSTVLGGDGWTSALAEVPVIVGSNGPSGVSPPNTTSMASSTIIGGLNMAETVAQGAPRGNSTLQLPAENQRRDELVLKQSRQLIPLKTTPKSSALNPTEKSKTKISQPHQVSSQVVNLSTVGGTGKSSAGRLQVLSREWTDVHPPTKDNMNPQNGTSKVAASAGVSLPSRTIPGNIVKTEGSAGPTVLEKRPNPHAESRNDFFNLMRKKSMTIPSPSSVVAVASANSNNEEEAVVEDAVGKETISVVDEEKPIKKVVDDVVENNNGVKEEPINTAAEADESIENEKSTTSSRPCSPDAILHSEEEEVAFMRSLGWEESTENTEEDEGLTEEEISTFYKFMDECLKLSPSSQTCRRVQSKLLGFVPCSESSSPRSSQV